MVHGLAAEEAQVIHTVHGLAAEEAVQQDLSLQLLLLLFQLLVHVLQDVLNVPLGDEADPSHLLLLLGGQPPLLQDGEDGLNKGQGLTSVILESFVSRKMCYFISFKEPLPKWDSVTLFSTLFLSKKLLASI